MFYFNCNIKTEVYFEHYNMDLICKDAEIFKRLTKKVESYCDREFGYIIEVIKNTKTHSESGIIVENTRIAADGCYVHVKFNCITFKPSKGQIMQIFVSEVSETAIIGKIGKVEVMIPRSRIDDQIFIYDEQQNQYQLQVNGEWRPIQIGNKLHCRCFQACYELNSQMKVIATIDEQMVNGLFFTNIRSSQKQDA